ncbi:hypothetical protein FK513_31890, partial [Klebsiella pneumoniae]|nr:hypothetical protein [Klebsiella pneumoniae]
GMALSSLAFYYIPQHFGHSFAMALIPAIALLIAATTPDAPGFAALRIESLEQHFNMLRRLAENWQSGKNRFNAPGETLLLDIARIRGGCWQQ